MIASLFPIPESLSAYLSGDGAISVLIEECKGLLELRYLFVLRAGSHQIKNSNYNVNK